MAVSAEVDLDGASRIQGRTVDIGVYEFMQADSTETAASAGGRIAFSSTRDGTPDIYVMDADGGNVVRLTSDDADDALAVWSPDGAKIAFTSDRDGSPDIYVMDADGSNVLRLTDNNAVDRFPAWGP